MGSGVGIEMRALIAVWSQMQPNHKILAIFIVFIFAIGLFLLEAGIEELLAYSNLYITFGLGIIIISVGIILSFMKPHPLTVFMIGLGLVMVFAGAYVGG